MWRQRKFFPFSRKCLMLSLWNLKLFDNTKSSLHITRASVSNHSVPDWAEERPNVFLYFPPLRLLQKMCWSHWPNIQLTSMASPKHSNNYTIFSGFEKLEPFFCELKFMKGESIRTYLIVFEGLPCTTNLSLCVSFLAHILFSAIQNTKLLIFQFQFWGSSQRYQRNAIVRMD